MGPVIFIWKSHYDGSITWSNNDSDFCCHYLNEIGIKRSSIDQQRHPLQELQTLHIFEESTQT